MKKVFAINVIRVQRVYGFNNSDTAAILKISRRTLGRITEKALTEGQIPYTPSHKTVAKVAARMHVRQAEVTARLPAATIAAMF